LGFDFTLEQLKTAGTLIGAAMAPTPARRWPLLDQRLDAVTIVKHENHAPTGAFKVRGGLLYMDRLKRERPGVPGVISATRGNHGQSLAFAGARAGVNVVIVVPRGNSVEKNAAMQALGAELIEHGSDFQEAREHAGAIAAERNLEFVPSFAGDLVLGVATYAMELFAAAGDLDVLYVPIGLGSGICGCILARDLLRLKTEIVGVQAEGAPAYALSFREGRPVSTNSCETFADGVATRIPDAAAVEIICKGAQRIVLVSDDEIAEAVRHYWTDTHNLAEGAGAAPLAGAIQERDRNRGRKIGLVLTGGNIDLALFRQRIIENRAIA
jgi:threonine dehydratase